VVLRAAGEGEPETVQAIGWVVPIGYCGGTALRRAGPPRTL